MRRQHLTASALAAALALIGASAADASTFCVPDYSAACPNNGTNIKAVSFDNALKAFDEDGVKDTIFLAPGTISDSQTMSTDSGGDDALEIIGAGVDETIVTRTGSANAFVLNLEPGGRALKMRDLTIRVPASYPDGLGGAAQVREATLERVDVDSRNDDSDGIDFVGGGIYRDGRMYGMNGGSVGTGITTNDARAGTMLVERATFDQPSWGFQVYGPDVPVTVRKTTITGAGSYGVRVAQGGNVAMENSIVTSSTGHAVSVEANSAGGGVFTGDHVTFTGNAASGDAALEVIAGATSTGAMQATALVTNSIVRGFSESWERSAPVSATKGNANVTFQYSNVAMGGTSTGDGSASTALGNIDLDPKFAGSGDHPLKLKLGSPSIDAGNPGAGGVTEDFTGTVRPLDGNADGTARRDQGAYETPKITLGGGPPAVGPAPGGGSPDPAPAGGGEVPQEQPQPQGGGTPQQQGGTVVVKDTLAPALSGLKLRGRTVRFTLSEAADVELKLKRGKRTVTIRISGKAGKNVLTLKRAKVRAARWQLTVSAVDTAGNRTQLKARRLTIKR